MGARDGGAVEPLADAVADAADASSQVVLHGRGILGGRPGGRGPPGSDPRPTRSGGSRSPLAARRARRRAARGPRRAPRPRGTAGRRRRRARGGRRSRGRPPADRTRAPRGARSSRDRRGSARGRRPACAGARRARCESSGPTTRMRSNAAGARPANVSSKRAWSRLRSSQASVSPPLRGLSDQLVATSRTRPPVERLPARGRMEDRRVDGVRDRPPGRAARSRARGASRARTATGGSSRRRARR